MPLADVSKGDLNGINLKATKVLIKSLSYAGFDTVPLEEVIKFMDEKRVRWAGFLDSFTIAEFFKKFKYEYMVIGSIIEWDDRAGKVGLVAEIFHLPEGKPFWGYVGALSFREKIKPFRFKEKSNIFSLFKELSIKLASGIPIGFTPKNPNSPPLFKLDSFSIVPKYVKKGETVSCRVRLKFLNGPPKRIYLYVKDIGIVPVAYEARSFVGYWKAPNKDGRYPVTLVLEWSKKKYRIFLSEFFVDSVPPKLELFVRGGVSIKGIKAFRKYIILVPRLKEKEPISRWYIEILDSEGNVLGSGGGKGSLPKRLVWKGLASGGVRLNTGIFTLTMKVWDRAGNVGEASVKVAVERREPKVKVVCIKESGGLFLIVSGEKDRFVPVISCKIKVFRKKGDLFKEFELEKLPARLDITGYRGRIVYYSIVVSDLLGNVYKDPFGKVKVRARMKKRKERKWIEEF